MNDKWNIYADKYVKYYEIKTDKGYYTFGSYDDVKSYYSKYYGSFDPVESEEEKNERLAREKAEERERKINMLLGE